MPLSFNVIKAPRVREGTVYVIGAPGGEAAADPAVLAARREAKAALDGAREKAQALLDDARQRLEKMEAGAAARGHEAGYRAGLAAAGREAAAVRLEAEAVLAAARQERDTLLQSAEPELMRLVVALVEKLVMAELAVDPGVVAGLCREALAAVAAAPSYQVYVHPDFLASLEENRAELVAALAPGSTLVLVADQGVAPGGCRVVNQLGEARAELPLQLEQLAALLRNGLPTNGGDS